MSIHKLNIKLLKMNITIKYFGQLTDITHLEEETLEFGGTYVYELLETLYRKYK